MAVLAMAVLAGPAPAAAATAAPSATVVSAAESAMLTALNKDRTAAHLVPVRTDPRLMAIARARSADMVAKHYFSHSQPDGRDIFDILSGNGVAWYHAGEIIAWNTHPTSATTAAANTQWMNSAPHHAIVVSNDFNYVGVGLAFDASTSRHYWTAVFIKGPDRTGPRISFATPTVSAGTTSANRRVTLGWSGGDVHLQVLTAGFRAYTVQSRVDEGAWRVVWSSTTRRSGAFILARGHTYEFRISGVDKRSNRGAWVTRLVDLR